MSETMSAEANALHAVLADDFEDAVRVLGTFHRNELLELMLACTHLHQLASEALPASKSGEEPEPCLKCLGCGQVADTDIQEPWTMWLDLPLKSSAAVLIGLVKPIPCPACSAAPGEEGSGGR